MVSGVFAAMRVMAVTAVFAISSGTSAVAGVAVILTAGVVTGVLGSLADSSHIARRVVSVIFVV
ncbi:hypothetical protein [Aeromicrobium phoceense]|uniref:hypothetical protein n=1 Tax=Aeromicrobium phoceense TaxID=2754045 RepID=UPI0028AB0C80|nr:hypothetical protein [Aeromicrobium phoceense]